MIIIDNFLRIPMSSLHPETLAELKSGLTFRNPAYGEALGRLKYMGRPNARPQGIPEFIKGWDTYRGNLIIPRGCARHVLNVLKERGYNPRFDNKTRSLSEVDFTFRGQLKPAQEPAVEAILQRQFSTICSPTGSGKTVMGLYIIAQRRQPTLVVVHTTALARQWAERATTFLDIKSDEIGLIGQGSKRIGKRLTIALVQTLRKCVEEVAPKIGHLIVDECHHLPAMMTKETVQWFDCKYMLGLSATHNRRDGLEPLIYWYIGPMVYEVSRSNLIQGGDIIHVEPIIRKTDWEPSDAITEQLGLAAKVASDAYHGIKSDATREQLNEIKDLRARLINELIMDKRRNAMIISDVVSEAARGPCIVLTDRKVHANILGSALKQLIKAEILHGEIPKQEQAEIIQAMEEGQLNAIVATGQLLGEGFDCKSLSTLFLTTPIKFSGRLIQYLGRVARTASGKTSARVYDYHDVNVPTLMKAARERLRTYNKLAKQTQGPTPVIKGE